MPVAAFAVTADADGLGRRGRATVPQGIRRDRQSRRRDGNRNCVGIGDGSRHDVTTAAYRVVTRGRIDTDGRIACFEIMLGTMPVRALIRDARTHQMAAVIETQAKEGMITMDKALANLYEKKLISADSIRAISRDASLTGLGQAL